LGARIAETGALHTCEAVERMVEAGEVDKLNRLQEKEPRKKGLADNLDRRTKVAAERGQVSSTVMPIFTVVKHKEKRTATESPATDVHNPCTRAFQISRC